MGVHAYKIVLYVVHGTCIPNAYHEYHESAYLSIMNHWMGMKQQQLTTAVPGIYSTIVLEYGTVVYYSSWYELKTPRNVVRIPNTDLAPFALCEFCKSMQTRWNGPQGPLITSLSKFRGPPELCEVRRRVLYKICKKCISRARAPRGHDTMRGSL